jgi:tRNA-2-methylthio-N6-dimethylallyladenosine synthase
MEDVRFDAAFIFKYSERKGTYAQRKIPDDVPGTEKTRRIVELVDLQKRITGEVNQALVGTLQDVLIEETVEKKPGFVSGRTDTFKHTILPSDGVETGDVVRVEIERARGATLYGRTVRVGASAAALRSRTSRAIVESAPREIASG